MASATSLVDNIKTAAGKAPASAVVGPTLALPNYLGNNVPAYVTTTMEFTYTSTTTIQPNTIHVTANAFSNCYLYDPTQGDKGPVSFTTVTVVPVQGAPTTGTATFMMKVIAGTGSVGFSAQADDAAKTKSAPYQGTISAINQASLSSTVTTNFLPAWDGKGDAPYATVTLKPLDTANHQYAGIDVLVYGEGFEENDDALPKYVDVALTKGGTPLTKYEKVDNIYSALRINLANAYGSTPIYITPKPTSDNKNPHAGFVTLHTKLANIDEASHPFFILDATNPEPWNTGATKPDIDKLDGLCLKPGPDDTNCEIQFPASESPSITAYAIINQVGTSAPVILDAKLARDVTTVGDVSGKYVQWPIPLATLNTCQVQSDQHRCQNCKPTDLNNLSYLMYESAGDVVTYSDQTSAYLDIFIGNEPNPNVTRTYAAPTLWAAKYDSLNHLVADYEIDSKTFITGKQIENGGLIIKIPDTDVQGKTIQGTVYMNGLNMDGTPTTPPTARREHPLLLTDELGNSSPKPVPAGGLDVPWPKAKVDGFDFSTAPDAGFFVEYWVVTPPHVPVTIYSKYYRYYLNTAGPYNY